MAAINKIGFDYEAMEQFETRWESPEDIIHYIRSGLDYLDKTNGSTDPEIIDKRNRWIHFAKEAVDCLSIVE